MTIIDSELFKSEAPAGSSAEAAIARELAGLLKEVSDWVRVVDTPVYSWLEEECSVEVGGESFACGAMPPTTSAQVEGEVKPLGSAPCQGSILLAPLPSAPEAAKFTVIEAYRRGYSAVLFYDPKAGRRRRAVISGDSTFSLVSGSPPPIPAVSIAADAAKALSAGSKRAVVSVKARIVRDALGKTVVAGVNGRGKGELHISAHHDHWFSGVVDSLTGLEVLLRLGSMLRKRWEGVDLLLISYTAKEFGCPGLPSWYWSWGSRYLLGLLEKRGATSRIYAHVALDELLPSSARASGHPLLEECLRHVESSFGVREGSPGELALFDSSSYLLLGIPSAALHSRPDSLEVSRSDSDAVLAVNSEGLNRLAESLLELIRCISSKGLSSGSLAKYIEGKAESWGSVGKYVAGKLLAALSLPDWGSLVRAVEKELFDIAYLVEPTLEFVAGHFAGAELLVKIKGMVAGGARGFFKAHSAKLGALLEVAVSDYNRDLALSSIDEAVKRLMLDYAARLSALGI